MGAWNTGIYDNDTALDFLQNIFDFMMKNAQRNEEYLVIADMCTQYPIVITGKEYISILDIIYEELKNIDDWDQDCIDDRECLLTQLKTALISKEEISNGN